MNLPNIIYFKTVNQFVFDFHRYFHWQFQTMILALIIIFVSLMTTN